MNWKFWKKSGEYKPSVVERIAANHWFLRSFGVIICAALLFKLAELEYIIGMLGVDLIQTNQRAAEVMRLIVVLPIACGIVFGVFGGAIQGSKGWIKIVLSIMTMTLATYQIAHLSKNRLATIENQVIERVNGVDKRDAIDQKIAVLRQTAAAHKQAAASTKAPYKWQQTEAQEAIGRHLSAADKANAELARLLDAKSKIPKLKPTEIGIMGSDGAKIMAISISVIVVISQWIVNVLLGILLSSFSIHKSNKFVKENKENVALQKFEAPLKQMREPMPRMPDLGGVPPDAAAAVVLSAGLLGGGGSAVSAAQNTPVVASSTPVVPSSSPAVVDFEALLGHQVVPNAVAATAHQKRTMGDLREAIKEGRCGTTVTDIKEYMDLTHNPAVEVRKKLCEEGIIKHYNYNEVKELIMAGK